jgi:hypothetical protein
MSQIKEVLLAFFCLVGGAFQVTVHKLVRPEYRYRIVLRNGDESPITLPEFSSTEEEATELNRATFHRYQPELSELERFTDGRWVIVHVTPNPNESVFIKECRPGDRL